MLSGVSFDTQEESGTIQGEQLYIRLMERLKANRQLLGDTEATRLMVEVDLVNTLSSGGRLSLQRIAPEINRAIQQAKNREGAQKAASLPQPTQVQSSSGKESPAQYARRKMSDLLEKLHNLGDFQVEAEKTFAELQHELLSDNPDYWGIGNGANALLAKIREFRQSQQNEALRLRQETKDRAANLLINIEQMSPSFQRSLVSVLLFFEEEGLKEKLPWLAEDLYEISQDERFPRTPIQAHHRLNRIEEHLKNVQIFEPKNRSNAIGAKRHSNARDQRQNPNFVRTASQPKGKGGSKKR